MTIDDIKRSNTNQKYLFNVICYKKDLINFYCEAIFLHKNFINEKQNYKTASSNIPYFSSTPFASFTHKDCFFPHVLTKNVPKNNSGNWDEYTVGQKFEKECECNLLEPYNSLKIHIHKRLDLVNMVVRSLLFTIH